MNNLNFYKKTIFIFILITFGLIIVSKLGLNIVKSEVNNLINSKKFEVFLFNQFNKKLESFANKQMKDEDYIFYKDNLKKIIIKYGPIFEEINEEIGKN